MVEVEQHAICSKDFTSMHRNVLILTNPKGFDSFNTEVVVGNYKTVVKIVF